MNPGPFERSKTLVLASLVALLAGCGAGNDDAAPPQAVPPAATGAPAATAVPDLDLPWSFNPARQATDALVVTRADCAAEPYTAEVRWSLVSSHGAQPEIWLASANQAPKLWVAPSQREGSKQTGAWLTASSTVYLVNGTEDSVIQLVRLADVSCGG